MSPRKKSSRKLLETHSRFSLHYLTGRNLGWYLPIITRTVIYLAALNSLLHLVSALPGLSASFTLVFIPIVVIVEFASYAWIGWNVAKNLSWKAERPNTRLLLATVSGALAGVFLGVYIALFKIFWFREVWTMFNVFIEPVVRGFEGLLFAGFLGLMAIITTTATKKPSRTKK